ncbi:hypothetical protein, partial [Clostridium sp.]|uniref:hypothetical protein n=1 Tax=Clostridium sp. TaxID=1506 RepID=UPI00258A2B5A
KIRKVLIWIAAIALVIFLINKINCIYVTDRIESSDKATVYIVKESNPRSKTEPNQTAPRQFLSRPRGCSPAVIPPYLTA